MASFHKFQLIITHITYLSHSSCLSHQLSREVLFPTAKREKEEKGKMVKASGIFVLISSIIVAQMVLSFSTVDAGEYQLGWIPTISGCKGTVDECLAGDEFEMDSEINRRILATRQYISYAALRRNSVPCSRRGASYYNCRPGAQANPYSRGCSAITRCRR